MWYPKEFDALIYLFFEDVFKIPHRLSSFDINSPNKTEQKLISERFVKSGEINYQTNEHETFWYEVKDVASRHTSAYKCIKKKNYLKGALTSLTKNRKYDTL